MSAERQGVDLDIVVYGATGFTGRQAAAYLAARAPEGLKLGIAGRSADKLAAVAAALGREVAVIVADSSDAATVDAMVARARVVLTTAGPFALYGTPVVEAAVAHGAHYVDITGESPWVAGLIADLHEAAASKGARIVPFCGFDSIPSDIGCFLVADYIRRELGADVDRVSAAFSMSGGGLNGGTLASALNMAEAGQTRALADPLLLNPPDRRTPEERRRSRDPRAPIYSEARGRWLAPFLMGPVNTRVVRRSNALFAEQQAAYGPEFTYREYQAVRGRAMGWGITWGLGAFTALSATAPGRSLARRFGPKPGQGPSEEAMDGGFFRARHVGYAADGRRVRAEVSFPGDAGNRGTVLMLCESALALAVDTDRLPGGPTRGGILTPAVAMGHVLVERLRAAGMTLTVEAD